MKYNPKNFVPLAGVNGRSEGRGQAMFEYLIISILLVFAVLWTQHTESGQEVWLQIKEVLVRWGNAFPNRLAVL